MKQILLWIALLMGVSNALTLEKVKAELCENSIPKDSLELSLEVSMQSDAIPTSQTMKILHVQKGADKIYSDMKTPLVETRTIIHHQKMKTVDLKTKQVKISNYTGELLETQKYALFNPLDSGKWQEPQKITDDIYQIRGDSAVVFYNAKKKRFEKLETQNAESSSQMEFVYDANDQLKRVTIKILAAGIETALNIEILSLRNSKEFPDKLFDI